MDELLMRRAVMSTLEKVSYLYTTDGSTSTVVNTNIRPFTNTYPAGFKIELEFDNIPEIVTEQNNRLISCESSYSPYPGFHLDRTLRSPNLANLQFWRDSNHYIRLKDFQLLRRKNTIVIIYDRFNESVTLNANGQTVSGSSLYSTIHNTLLTFGGQIYTAASSPVAERCTSIAIRDFSITALPIPQSQPRNYTDENGVIHYENYSTDGTQSTAINTGLRLFSSDYPNGFELNCEAIPLENGHMHTLLCCMSEAGSPWPGFVVRHENSKMKFTMSNVSGKTTDVAGISIINIRYDGSTISGSFNGNSFSGKGAVATHNFPLAFGGSLSSPTQWVSNRFCKMFLKSLTIKKL